MNDYSRNDMVNGFVNYDFGMVKPMLAAQYWDNGKAGELTKTRLRRRRLSP